MRGAFARAATTRRSTGILWRSISLWKASLSVMVLSDSSRSCSTGSSRLYQRCIRSNYVTYSVMWCKSVESFRQGLQPEISAHN